MLIARLAAYVDGFDLPRTQRDQSREGIAVHPFDDEEIRGIIREECSHMTKAQHVSGISSHRSEKLFRGKLTRTVSGAQFVQHVSVGSKTTVGAHRQQSGISKRFD